MGKRKIEIEKIENKDKRMIAFSKRRQGLFKKAADVCRLCDAQIAILTFSSAGKLYSFGHTSVDDVIHRFLTGEEKEEKNIKYKYETDFRHQTPSSGGFWWDNINMEELDSVEKLQVVYNAMLNLKRNVSNRIEKLESLSPASSPLQTTTVSTTTSQDPCSSTEGLDFFKTMN